MPGISFIYSADHNLGQKKPEIISALDSLMHSSFYQREILLSTPTYLLATTRYEEYPISFCEDERFYICLEGQLSVKRSVSLKAELHNLAMLIFSDQSETQGRLAKRLLESNGEFTLFVLKKDSAEVAILSDAMGHLPVYYCKSTKVLLLSREIRFIARLVDDLKIDRFGLAQYLMFSYPLERRSLFENIFRLDSSGIIRIGLETGDIDIKTLLEFNFDHKQYAHRSLQDNAKHLVEILVEGCEDVSRSMPEFKNVLGLSGGLDSRIVMLAMQKASVPFFAATRLDVEGRAARDVAVAKQLTDLYNLSWKLFELHYPKFRDALHLLRRKNGLNYLGLSFMLPFLEGLQENYGKNMVYWTGDSGLVVRREIPDEPLRNYDDLVDCILRHHEIFDLDNTAGLLDMNVETLRDEIKHVLEGYPEKSLYQKYVHFVIYGRIIKWHYEGMDRNRSYFWMCAPLEFTTFINYAMNCPDNQKRDYRLYRSILEQMSPKSCRIVYAQYSLAPASVLFPISLRMRSLFQKMPASVRNITSVMLRRNRHARLTDGLLAACIKQQINDHPIISEYFSRAYVDELLPNCNQWQKKLLLSATSIIEDLTTPTSCLENHLDSDFV